MNSQRTALFSTLSTTGVLTTNRRRSVTGVLVATILLSIPHYASAQWVVHDPVAYVNHILRYEQLVLEYEMFYYELRGLQNLGMYKSPRTILRILGATGLLNAGPLKDVLNRGRTPEQVDAAFDEAFTRVRDARGFLFRLRYDPASVAADIVELLEVSGESAAGTIGQIRQSEDDYQLALKNLDGDTAAAYGIKSTEKSVLQKINSATMMQVKEQHKANELMLHLLEQQLIANQQQREALVAAVNLELQRRQMLPLALSYAQNARVPEP